MSGSGDAAEGSGSRLKIKESGDPVVEVRGTRGPSGHGEGTFLDLDIALIGSGDRGLLSIQNPVAERGDPVTGSVGEI